MGQRIKVGQIAWSMNPNGKNLNYTLHTYVENLVARELHHVECVDYFSPPLGGGQMVGTVIGF